MKKVINKVNIKERKMKRMNKIRKRKGEVW
jgi:hypothetical protein